MLEKFMSYLSTGFCENKYLLMYLASLDIYLSKDYPTNYEVYDSYTL